MSTSTSTEWTLMSSKEILNMTKTNKLEYDSQTDAFTAVMRLIKSLKFTTLADFSLSSKSQNLRATFSSFAKRQVGGPREISIMEVELRILVKTLEVIFKMANTKIEVEMLTADDKVSRMKNISLNHDSMRSSKGPSLAFHACSDVTRWNQNWTSQKTSLSILSLELPLPLESRLLSLASSFSVKFVTLNSKLIKRHVYVREQKCHRKRPFKHT